jgi:actin-related protein
MDQDQTAFDALILDQTSNTIRVGMGSQSEPVLELKQPFFYRTKDNQQLKFGHQDMNITEEPRQIYDIYLSDGKVAPLMVHTNQQVVDWKLWTEFLIHLLQELQVAPPKTSLFVIEHPNHAKTNVKEMTRLAFDKLKFHSIYVGSQPGTYALS